MIQGSLPQKWSPIPTTQDGRRGLSDRISACSCQPWRKGQLRSRKQTTQVALPTQCSFMVILVKPKSTGATGYLASVSYAAVDFFSKHQLRQQIQWMPWLQHQSPFLVHCAALGPLWMVYGLCIPTLGKLQKNVKCVEWGVWEGWSSESVLLDLWITPSVLLAKPKSNTWPTSDMESAQRNVGYSYAQKEPNRKLII